MKPWTGVHNGGCRKGGLWPEASQCTVFLLLHAVCSLQAIICRLTSMSWGPFADVYLHSTWNTPTVKPMHLTAATLSWHSSRCWAIGRMLGQFDPAQHTACLNQHCTRRPGAAAA